MLVPELTPASPRGSRLTRPPLLCVSTDSPPHHPWTTREPPSGSDAVDAGPKSPARAGTISPEDWEVKSWNPSSFPQKMPVGLLHRGAAIAFFSAPPLGGSDQGLKRNKIRPTSEREQTTSNQTDSHLLRVTHCAGHFLSAFLTWWERSYVTLSHRGSSFLEPTLFLFPPENFASLGIWINTRLLLIWVTTTVTNIKWKSLHSLLYVRSLTLDIF